MALYVIADLHLSLSDGIDKSMEVFGPRWADYTDRIRRNWTRLVSEDDTVIIPGDISWALTLAEAKDDLAFLEALPGKKILMKGNHDFWWSSLKKMEAFCSENGFSTLSFLYHSACPVEGVIVTGTRGWYWAESGEDTGDSAKLVAREALRLGMALDAAKKLQAEDPASEIIAFFHYPPVWGGVPCTAFTEQLLNAGVHRCYFGHVHGMSSICRFSHSGVSYSLISADALGFTPCFIPQENKAAGPSLPSKEVPEKSEKTEEKS